MMKRLFNKKFGGLVSLGLLSLVFVSPVSAEVRASWSAELVD